LKRLSLGETAVSDIARPFSMSLPAVSKHLRVLQRAGLVSSVKKGRIRRARISAAPMRKAAEWLATYRIFWESNLDSLARYLESETGPESQNTKSN
jgi:DNA-binding transcriptional ArsR family regulator